METFPKRNTSTDVVKSGVLVLFTKQEFEFVERIRNQNVTDIPSPLGSDPFKQTRFVVPESGATSETNQNGKKIWRIPGYRIPPNSGLDGVTSDGKPTDATITQILNAVPSGNIPEKVNIILSSGQNVEIRREDISAIIRMNKGLDAATFVQDPNQGNKYTNVVWGHPKNTTSTATMAEESTTFNPSSRAEQGPNGNLMGAYIWNHSAGRKIVDQINKNGEEKDRLIANGTLIPAIEENSLLKGDESHGSGISTVYVYAPGTEKAGQNFDMNAGISDIYDKYGINFDKNGRLNKTGEAVNAEVDHLSSGKVLRDSDSLGMRTSDDGVKGGPTLNAVKTFTIERDENGKVKKDSKTGYVIYKIVKGAKQITAGTVDGAILAAGMCTITGNKNLASTLSHWSHAGGHGGFGGNALLGLKIIGGIVAVAVGKGDWYNNPLTPLIIHKVIEKIADRIATSLATRIALPVSATGVGLALDVVWITLDLWYNIYYAPKKQEEEERERLRQEAIVKGCWPERYVATGGISCIRCDNLDNDPTKTKQSELPIGVERDKNGDIIYVADPNQPKMPIFDFKNGEYVIVGYAPVAIPKYIYPRNTEITRDNHEQDKKNNKLNEKNKGRSKYNSKGRGKKIINVKTETSGTSDETIACFSKNTNVLTPTGNKPIQDLKIGDNVISFDSQNNLEIDEVVNIFEHKNSEIFRYELSNHTSLLVTNEHPVFIGHGRFIPIGEMTEEDSLFHVSGELVKILSKEYIGIEYSYNIQVKKNSTYIANGIFVHNKGLISETIIDKNGKETEIIAAVPSIITDYDYNMYGNIISSTYADSKNTQYTIDLLKVRFGNNQSSVNSTLNTGPMLSTRPSTVSGQPNNLEVVRRELDDIKKRDDYWLSRDSYTYSMLWAAGIIKEDSSISAGGGTQPPSPGGTTPPNPDTPVPGGKYPPFPYPILFDLGDTILYINGAYGSYILKNDRPKKEYYKGVTTCFPEWVKIMTKGGEIAIKDVKPGMIVYSMNKFGLLEETIVTNFFVHNDKKYPIYRYSLSDGQFLDCTENHVVLTSSGVYKHISNITPIDRLITSKNEEVSVLSIDNIGEFFVYNINVEDNQNYIVNNIVVGDG